VNFNSLAQCSSAQPGHWLGPVARPGPPIWAELGPTHPKKIKNKKNKKNKK